MTHDMMCSQLSGVDIGSTYKNIIILRNKLFEFLSLSYFNKVSVFHEWHSITCETLIINKGVFLSSYLENNDFVIEEGFLLSLCLDQKMDLKDEISKIRDKSEIIKNEK